MSTNHEPSVMRRKAGAGRPPPEIGQLTPARALRGAVARAAQDVAALAAVAGHVDEARVTLEPAVAALPEHPLLALVEGAGSRFGLVVLDPQAVAALIEMQTTGRVVPRPAEPRPPTRTDAIMCADFIDRVLELVDQQLAEADLPLAPVFAGFRYAMALAEIRAVAMTLDDIAYRRLALTVDFGHGAKTGQIVLLLPHDPPGIAARGGSDVAEFTAALHARVLAAPVRLTAYLARREMTLAAVAQLAVGSLVALPREALGAVEIVDLSGKVVAQGRLGQAEGHRAIRLGGAAQGPVAAPGDDFPFAAGTPAFPPEQPSIGERGGMAEGDDLLAALATLGGDGDPQPAEDGGPMPLTIDAPSFAGFDDEADLDQIDADAVL